MNKLASFNYDILDHILSGDLEKVARVVSTLSDEAQTAIVPDFDEMQNKPDKDFALVTFHPGQGEIKKFAKYDKISAELSIGFLKETYKDLPDEIIKTAATNLSKAATVYGLSFPSELSEYVKKASYINPVVNLTNIDEYAYTQKLAWREDGNEPKEFAIPSESKYPISNKEEVEKAAKYFNTYAHEFNPSQAMEYASNVKKAADTFDVNVEGSRLEKFANLSVSEYSDDLKLHLQARKDYIPTTQKEARSAYEELEKNASAMTPGDLARKLTELDVENKIAYQWGQGLENPAVAVFKKKAMKKEEVTLEQLRNIPVAELTALVGTEAVTDLRSDEGVQVYKTLPRPIKKAVKELCEQSY